MANHCKPNTQREYRRSVELFINPALSKAKVLEISRSASIRPRSGSAMRSSRLSLTIKLGPH